MARNALRLKNSNSVFRSRRTALAGAGLCLGMNGANPCCCADKKCESEETAIPVFHVTIPHPSDRMQPQKGTKFKKAFCVFCAFLWLRFCRVSYQGSVNTYNDSFFVGSGSVMPPPPEAVIATYCFPFA